MYVGTFAHGSNNFDVVTSSVSPTDWHILSEELEEPKATSLYRGQDLIPIFAQYSQLSTSRRRVLRLTSQIAPPAITTRPAHPTHLA